MNVGLKLGTKIQRCVVGVSYTLGGQLNRYAVAVRFTYLFGTCYVVVVYCTIKKNQNLTITAVEVHFVSTMTPVASVAMMFFSEMIILHLPYTVVGLMAMETMVTVVMVKSSFPRRMENVVMVNDFTLITMNLKLVLGICLGIL